MKKYIIGLIVLVIILGIALVISLKKEGTFGLTDYPVNRNIFNNWHSNTASVSCNADNDIVFYHGDPYASVSAGDRVQFSVVDNVDIMEGFNYFVKTASQGYGFEISSTSGGTAFNIAADCAGGVKFHQIKKGTNLDVSEYVYNSVFIAAAEAPTVIFKIVGSTQEAEPDFLASPSMTNRWERVAVYDIQNNTEIEGNTGVAFTGTADYRMFQFYGNAYKWLSVVIDSIASAAFTIELKSNN